MRYHLQLPRPRRLITPVLMATCVLTLGAALGVKAQDAVGPSLGAGSIRQHFDSTRPELTDDRLEDGQAIVVPDFASEIRIEAEAQPGEPTLLLNAWEFQGNQVFNSEKLRSVLESMTDRNLTINHLYSAARVIEAYYASAGYVAQATLPPQEVVDGVVRMQVVEAKYAGVEFEGTLLERVRPQVIQNIFDTHVPAVE